MSDYGMESECKAWRPQSESKTTIVQLEKDYRHLSGLQGYLCWYTHLRNVYKIDRQTFFRSHSIWYQNIQSVYDYIQDTTSKIEEWLIYIFHHLQKAHNLKIRIFLKQPYFRISMSVLIHAALNIIGLYYNYRLPNFFLSNALLSCILSLLSLYSILWFQKNFLVFFLFMFLKV